MDRDCATDRRGQIRYPAHFRRNFQGLSKFACRRYKETGDAVLLLSDYVHTNC